MGQPRVASATWRGQNRRISRDFYEGCGTADHQDDSSGSRTGVWSCKNSKSCFEITCEIPSETEGKSSNFAPYGMAVFRIHCWLDSDGSAANRAAQMGDWPNPELVIGRNARAALQPQNR